MAGLRDLSAPVHPLTEVAPSNWTAEDAARIGASPFQRGLRSAGIADQAGARMQAALEAAARGDKAEAMQLRQEAEELAGRSAAYSPPVGSYKDVTNASTGRDYLMGVAGQGIRSTLPSIAGGLVAAATARFGLRAGPRMTELAGAGGALIPAYGMEKREAVMNATADPTIMNTHTPQEILNTATVKGGVNAGLEAAFPAVVAGRTINAGVRGAMRPTLGGVARGVAGDIAIEGGTEAVQEKVGQMAQGHLNPQRSTTSDVDNMIDAAISGAVTAPLLGGHSHAIDAAKAISDQVRARAAVGVDTSAAGPGPGSIPLEPNAPPDLQPQSYPLNDTVAPSGPGPLGMFADKQQTMLDRGRAEWLMRKNEGAAMPPEVRAGGKDAVVNWLGQQDQERFNYVKDHFQSILDDPTASEQRKTQATDLLSQFQTDPKGTFNRAATLIATEDKARRATEAIKDFAQPAQDFLAGLAGKEQPKHNAQYDATDRALYSVFHSSLPHALQGDQEAVLATDMIRRFARGQLPPSMGVKTAHLMVQTYGDQAVQVAEEAARILRQDGVSDEATAKLPRIIKDLVGDEESRISMMSKGLDPLVSNTAREEFKQAMGREFTTRDLGRVSDALDQAAVDGTPHEGLQKLFGKNYEKAINVARAVHDARHKAVSNFNKLLEGPTTDETQQPVDPNLDEEGNAANADFQARSAEKAVETSSPTIYSFSDGDRTSASKGFGKPYDTKTEASKIAARKEKLAKLYPGATVHEVPAAQAAKALGVSHEGGGVVLQVVRPTNQDALSFDRETTKKLLRARTIERNPQPGDSVRDKRYSIQINKAGGEFTKVTNPGADEGAMYVALNKADGSPLVNGEGKREYAMVTTHDLIAEMRKRDSREGVTSSTDEGPARDLKLLSAGLTSLITSSDSMIDRNAGITFVSADGKRSTVALSPEGKASLPDNLKVGNTTVGEIRQFGSLTTQEIKNDVLQEFSTLGKDEVKGALHRLFAESLVVKKLGAASYEIQKLVQQYGFPRNARENLTVEQKQALTEENWGALVDHIVGKDGPKRELYNHFYTPKGYSKLTERARAIREAMPELERRAELILKGETIDAETGLPVKNDTDNAVKPDTGESRLLTEEKTRDEVAYFTRTQTTHKETAAKAALAAAPLKAEKSIPMYYKMAPFAIRKELRAQYPNGTTTAQMIRDGNRTATTRTPFGKPGMIFKIDDVPGLFRITDVHRIDLQTPQGREAWSKLEGWDTDFVAKALKSQVYHGAVQTVFERINGEQDTKKTTVAFDDRPVTDAEKGQIESYVDRVLGSKFKVAFEENLGHSGEWDQNTNTIKIAVMAGVNGMSVAQHEALHAFFNFLGRHGHQEVVATLQAAAGAPANRRQLERLLTNEPAALRQLNDPEERAAYMYQFWVASKAGAVDFRIGPETEGLFSKIAAFFRKALNILTAEEKADRILQAFHDGQMKTPSAVAIVSQALRSSEKAVGLRTMLGDGLKKAQAFTQPAYDFMANSKNSEITKIANLFYRDSISTEGGQGFINARSQQGAIWLNKFSSIVEGATDADLVAARDVLQGRTIHVENAKVASIVNLTRQLLRQEFFPYMKDAKVNVEFRKNYFPRVWDMEKIIMDASGFRAKLLQHHADELAKLGDFAYNSAVEQHNFDKGNNPNAVPPDRAQYTAETTADHIIATLSQQYGVVPDESDPSKAALREQTSRPGFTPFMQAVNKRTLNFLDMKVFGEYQKDDLINIMSTYLLNGVRRAEYARRFGNDGEELGAMMDRAIELERSIVGSERGVQARSLHDDTAVIVEVNKRMAAYTKAIMAMEGTLGYDISPTMRRVNSGMMVYQNLRILPLAIFSSLIDPLGITIRSGQIKDAFDAFTTGMRGLTASITKDNKSDAGAHKLAELLGVVDNKQLLDSLGQTYHSVYLYGWAKKLNEKLFQFNGMESWNRSMRVVATQVAIKFIGRHAQGESADHSERWLSELGLKAADVKFNEDGTVKALKEEGLTDTEAAKMRVAIQRFVDSAVLRPSSAQRPAWASDPHYALFFHLKQFTYSFQQVILRRAWHEWKHGNLQPAMVLMSYVPLMLAADIAKGFIQGGGEEPDWKKGWTVGDYTANAVQRAGLLGTGQFLVDAKHSGITTLGGPTVDQFTRAFTDSPKETAVRALPGNPLYRDMVLSNDDYRS